MKCKYFLALAATVLLSNGVAAQETRGYSLEDLYRLAETENRQLKVSRAGVEVSAEDLKSARSARLPDVNMELSGSYIVNAQLMSRSFSRSGSSTVIVPGLGPQSVANGKQDTPHWGNSFTAQAAQVVYSGGAIGSSIKIAELGLEIAKLDVDKNRQEVRFLITGYALDIYNLENQASVVEKNIELTRQIIQNMRARHSQGTVLENDITRYELELKTLELSHRKLADAMEIANYQLATALNLPTDSTIHIDKRDMERSYNNVAAANPESDWHKLAELDNISLKQAALGVKVSEQGIRQARSSFLPSVSLIAENNLAGPYTNDLIPVNSNVNVWFVGVGVKYNLGSIWTNKHPVRKAKAKSVKATEELQQAKEAVGEGVHACYVNLTTSFAEVGTQEKNVELADQNYSVVKNRYDNGLALLTELLDASNTKLSAERALVNARISLLYNYFKLKYMTSNL